MIRLIRYTPYLERKWEKLSESVECDLMFKNEDELDIYRDCLEAEYIDDFYGDKVKMMLEFVEYE